MTTLIQTKAFWIGSFVFLGILAAFYIFQMSMLTHMAYQIAEKEKEIALQRSTIEHMEGTLASTIQFQNYQSMAENLGFEKVRRVSYLELGASQVAQVERSL